MGWLVRLGLVAIAVALGIVALILALVAGAYYAQGNPEGHQFAFVTAAIAQGLSWFLWVASQYKEEPQ